MEEMFSMNKGRPIHTVKWSMCNVEGIKGLHSSVGCWYTLLLLVVEIKLHTGKLCSPRPRRRGLCPWRKKWMHWWKRHVVVGWWSKECEGHRQTLGASNESECWWFYKTASRSTGREKTCAKGRHWLRLDLQACDTLRHSTCCACSWGSWEIAVMPFWCQDGIFVRHNSRGSARVSTRGVWRWQRSSIKFKRSLCGLKQAPWR